MNGKVNIPIQCLATLFLPTGIYAFKKINKIKQGGIVYVITTALWIISSFFLMYSGQVFSGVFGLTTALTGLMGIIAPMLFMNLWSQDWNKKIEEAKSPIS